LGRERRQRAGNGLTQRFPPEGRTIWIADAHRGDGKRFVARADEKLTAFLELESLVKNEDKADKPEQPLLPLRKMRSASGQARTSRRDIS